MRKERDRADRGRDLCQPANDRKAPKAQRKIGKRDLARREKRRDQQRDERCGEQEARLGGRCWRQALTRKALLQNEADCLGCGCRDRDERPEWHAQPWPVAAGRVAGG